MKKSVVTLIGLTALAPVWAQDATVREASASARTAYQERQALAEVPNLIKQFDQMVENQEQIVARLVKVETGSGDLAELRAEIDKLRGEVAELRAVIRRDQDAMRREIVEDLSNRLNGIDQKMQQNQAQAIARMQARGEAALQAAEQAAKAAREQAEYTKRNSSRPAAPSASRTSGGTATANPSTPTYSAYYEHVVEPNQTLLFIAKGYDTTVQKILAANPGVKATNLRIGQKLIIPAEETPKTPPPKTTPAKRK